ncbi:MAG: hypothetical protein ACFB6S_17845 [Geminicoccaceae bacterium]
MVGFKRWFAIALVWAVPALASLIAVRQYVLQHLDDLSIWEGGGMGMYAEIGGFARIINAFVIDEMGLRHPIVLMTDGQQELAGFARKHPTPENMARLADVLRRQEWAAVGEAEPRLTLTSSGAEASQDGPMQNLLVPGRSFRHRFVASMDHGGGTTPARIEIEFWKIRYDPETRIAERTLAYRHTSR